MNFPTLKGPELEAVELDTLFPTLNLEISLSYISDNLNIILRKN